MQTFPPQPEDDFLEEMLGGYKPLIYEFAFGDRICFDAWLGEKPWVAELYKDGYYHQVPKDESFFTAKEAFDYMRKNHLRHTSRIFTFHLHDKHGVFPALVPENK